MEIHEIGRSFAGMIELLFITGNQLMSDISWFLLSNYHGEN